MLTHLLLDELKKSAGEEDGDARVVVVTSALHDVEHSKKRGRELYSLTTLGQLSLASLRGRLIEYQLRLDKGGNVTSAGWQVTLCDPMWHVSSRSGVATLRTATHLLLTYLL